MTPVPIVLLGFAVAGLGAFMFVRRRKGEPKRPFLIGVHLLLAVGMLEGLMVLIQHAPEEAKKGGETAAVLIGAALFCALTSAVMRGRNAQGANGIFYAHAAAGLCGVLLLAGWASSL